MAKAQVCTAGGYAPSRVSLKSALVPTGSYSLGKDEMPNCGGEAHRPGSTCGAKRLGVNVGVSHAPIGHSATTLRRDGRERPAKLNQSFREGP